MRQMLATLLEIAQVRLELVATEIEQEKLRVFDALLLAGVGLVLLSVGTVLLCGFALMLISEGYRLAALGVLALALLAGGVLALRAGGQRLRGPGGIFGASLAEISQDREGLAPRE